jgi:hypothetical protein
MPAVARLLEKATEVCGGASGHAASSLARLAGLFRSGLIRKRLGEAEAYTQTHPDLANPSSVAKPLSLFLTREARRHDRVRRLHAAASRAVSRNGRRRAQVVRSISQRPLIHVTLQRAAIVVQCPRTKTCTVTPPLGQNKLRRDGGD